MAKQIMINDDIAGKLNKIREERSCSYSVVIDELLSEREKSAPEEAKDFFTVAAAFDESIDEYGEYEDMCIEKNPDMLFRDMLKDEKAMSKFRQCIKNYLICEDLVKYLSEKDVEEYGGAIAMFLLEEKLLFNYCQYFIPNSHGIIFSSSRKKVLEEWEPGSTEEFLKSVASGQEKISLSQLL